MLETYNIYLLKIKNSSYSSAGYISYTNSKKNIPNKNYEIWGEKNNVSKQFLGIYCRLYFFK